MSTSSAAFDLLSHGGLLALPVAFLAGVVAALNPCCVALYPSAAAVCCAANTTTDTSAGTRALFAGNLRNSIGLVFGLAVATTMLGVIAALVGGIVGQFGSGVRYAVASVPIVMGLHLLRWLKLPINSTPHRTIRNGLLGAFGAGFLLSLALTPCATPVLASILSYVAFQGSVVLGAALLLAYGIGSGIPAALVGAAAGQLGTKLERAGYGLWSERINGAGLVILGLFLVWRA